ncbi:hypothetical protein [Sphingobium estronivorans]|uniref:hypothetical protein n=1 Tax=Sphingobium estronivorans TaxID=1577690 RepID=UPI00123C5504|nr:hypothetical protein [Sphingobium estronivorans]
MTDMSFTVASETHETIDVRDMGEGALILIEPGADGRPSEQVAIHFDQIAAIYSALAPRYASQALAA